MNLNLHPILIAEINAIKELNQKIDAISAPGAVNDVVADQLRQTISAQQQVIGDQQQQINDLSAKLDAVLNQMSAFEESLSQCCTQSGHTQRGSNDDLPQLEQNVPNPFSSSTYIKFYVPMASKSAHIVISDSKGAAVMQFDNLETGFGTVTIGAGELASGTYRYTLVIDERLVDTKTMVLTD